MPCSISFSEYLIMVFCSFIEADIPGHVVTNNRARGQGFNKCPQAVAVRLRLLLVRGGGPVQGDIAARRIASARIVGGGFFLLAPMSCKPMIKSRCRRAQSGPSFPPQFRHVIVVIFCRAADYRVPPMRRYL